MPVMSKFKEMPVGFNAAAKRDELERSEKIFMALYVEESNSVSQAYYERILQIIRRKIRYCTKLMK